MKRKTGGQNVAHLFFGFRFIIQESLLQLVSPLLNLEDFGILRWMKKDSLAKET